jgi:hypothetical protein
VCVEDRAKLNRRIPHFAIGAYNSKAFKFTTAECMDNTRFHRDVFGEFYQTIQRRSRLCQTEAVIMVIVQKPAEISGMVNSSHMTFAEHLLVYFVETCRSREAAEQKVLWFLACLLYFSERQWDRAISYATMLGCLKDPQHDLH